MTLYALKRPDGTLDGRFIFDDADKCWTHAWRHGTKSIDAMKSRGYSVVHVCVIEEVTAEKLREALPDAEWNRDGQNCWTFDRIQAALVKLGVMEP